MADSQVTPLISGGVLGCWGDGTTPSGKWGSVEPEAAEKFDTGLLGYRELRSTARSFQLQKR
ncbi:hypothetical protein GCM10010347_47330 [Streptomyces cirratus]|uniref:Uncharacterized protein n=1 Tax=Streptomyces cirratus TaxID=68187 RepID=A0ABQ3F3M9_9ACTN|nr:hypothetical protein GCM10010347_47330 [Streptomyces cirratus]